MSNIIKMGGEEKKWRPSRRIVLIGLLGISTVGIGLFLVFSDAARNSLNDKYQAFTDPAKGACSDNKSLIDEYNTVTRGLDPKPYEALRDKITKLPGMKEDASCVYMHMMYEIRYGDIYTAKKLLGELRELEKANKKISRLIDDDIDRQKLYGELDATGEKSTEVDG